MQTWLGLDPWMWITIEAVVLAVLFLATMLALKARAGRHHRRTRRLHRAFGPEYDRTVEEKGRGKGEADLDLRADRSASLEVHPLSAIEGQRYAEEWSATESRFVDDPGEAITGADRLVKNVLEARGYPAGDFATSADAVSVDHPRVVVDYRAAHDVAERNRRGDASTEDLRLAMTKYRQIFNELLEVREPSGPRQPAATG